MSLRTIAASGPSGTAPMQGEYRKTFVQQVIELVREGYALLTASTLKAKEEPAITGLLVDKIRSFIQARRESPGEHWSWRYAVHDDPPVSTGGEEGKRRPRVDIRIEALYPDCCPRMPFEAKRLYPRSGPGQYTGADGMGCFLTERYGVGCPDVAMLGYVQSQTLSHWEQTVKGAILTNRAALGVLPETGDCFNDVSTLPESSHFYSTHNTNPSSAVLVMHHILLQCF